MLEPVSFWFLLGFLLFFLLAWRVLTRTTQLLSHVLIALIVEAFLSRHFSLLFLCIFAYSLLRFFGFFFFSPPQSDSEASEEGLPDSEDSDCTMSSQEDLESLEDSAGSEESVDPRDIDCLMTDNEGSEEECEVYCFCGSPAKLRLSRTARNPYRPFYSCSKRPSQQCGYFCWFEEFYPRNESHLEELDPAEMELYQLQQRMNEEKAAWEREKLELTSQLSRVQAELDEIKERIEVANADIMPPLDRSCEPGDESDGSVIKHTIQL
ncbi:Zinc finger, GRF-type [Dillenia turbinata]|uniref:Zinc finger, GRF-type n=1 Tax=Dillenia turbinata TaxID=194707 RepID=A0AAN8YXZ9_9MAGN